LFVAKVRQNAPITVTMLNKKLSYCCDSRSYCMQKYDQSLQIGPGVHKLAN